MDLEDCGIEKPKVALFTYSGNIPQSVKPTQAF